MKIIFSSSGLTILLLTGLAIMSCSNQKADLVFKNAIIHTVNDAQPKAEAVAILGKKILAVGSNEEIASLIGSRTEVRDLGGKTVVPGFIDSHYHFMGVGKREFQLNLDGTKSLQEFLDKVKAEATKKSKGEWIVGRGWIEEDWLSKQFPTRYDLDKVASDNPVILGRADGHAIVVNSLALNLAGISKASQNPQGGEILRDKNGEPNGLFLDKAMALVRKQLPPDTTNVMMRKYSKKAQEVALAYGITQIHDMGTSWWAIDGWKKLYMNDELKIRIYAYIRGPSEDAELLLKQGSEIGLFDDRLTVRGIKISSDGALGSRGAALLEPYSDTKTTGHLLYKKEEIYPVITQALNNDIQMAIHAIGDHANRFVLDLFERAFNEVPASQRSHMPPRFRIEHAQIVHPDDIPRFASLGIIPSMQPSHAIGDLHFAVRRLGAARMERGYAWRKFIDQGNYIPAGSDAPVEEGNPMIEFYAAVARKDTTGFSADGWFPEYRMTREEALKSLTTWGAKAAFMEKMIGSIEPGKYADLVVLEKDLMTEPEERLFDIKVLMTVVGGEIVYEREQRITAKN